MPETPKNTTKRPARPDTAVDVFGQILEAVHVRTAIFGRLDLGAPWHLQIPERDYLSFYVVARGSAWLELPRSRGVRGATSIALSTGDAVILPLGSAHGLRDVDRSDVPALQFHYDACPRSMQVERIGGDGPLTSIVVGHFTLGRAPRNALLASLPPAIHLPAGAGSTSPQLAGLVPLIVNETTTPGPGASIVLARLADLLFVQALRLWISRDRESACGLRAVTDPAIGDALRLMHARPADPWTVEKLASTVAMSRSAFAARFTALVSEPPLQYLAHWRMALAAQQLREDGATVARIATSVGYSNPVAFSKAFAKAYGVGPATFRRRERGEEDRP
ncbi:MAG TPA: AraC family transcriptional regulator [Gemmatimonadaceae bacterium]|nr:AraC family transcriptional regulator [Gemmatimonadaceae bacterium]